MQHRSPKVNFSKSQTRFSPGNLLFWAFILLMGSILCFFWEPLRSTGFILYLQGYRSAAADIFFRAFTFLGDDYFYMLFFCVMIWCVDKPLGLSAAAVLLLSGAGSNFIKEAMALPRPVIEGVLLPESYAFPSGHALTAVTLWGYLAAKIKKGWLWGWAIIATIIIGFSRLILGFHFAGDVLGGIFLGMIFLKLFLWVDSFLTGKKAGFVLDGKRRKKCLPYCLLLFLTVIVPLLLVIILPGGNLAKVFGALAGGSAGYILEAEKNRSLTRGTWGQQLLKILLGVAGIVGINFILGVIFPQTAPFFSFIRYALISFWITFLAPFIFVRASLSPQDKNLHG